MEPLKGGLLAKLPSNVANILDEYNPHQSYASWALRFCFSLDNIVTVLSGMSEVEQIAENIKVMNNFRDLTPEEMLTIKKASTLLHSNGLIPCTQCNYFYNCPKKVQMPKIFALYNRYYQGHQSHDDSKKCIFKDIRYNWMHVQSVGTVS